MQYSKWQQKVSEDSKDIDIIEVMTVRGAGKTTFGIQWLTEDANVAYYLSGKHADDKINLDGINKHLLFIKVSNLNEMKSINKSLPKDTKVKVFVDDYFHRSETLDEFDAALNRTDYKILFAGTRKDQKDKFKIDIAKHYYVGLDFLISEGNYTVDTLVDLLKKMDADNLNVEFGVPFEQN